MTKPRPPFGANLTEAVANFFEFYGNDNQLVLQKLESMEPHLPEAARRGYEQELREYDRRQRAAATSLQLKYLAERGKDFTESEEEQAAWYKAHREKEFWDQYAIYGGIILRWATKKQLLEGAAHRMENGETQIRRGKFENAIGQLLPQEDSIVDDHLTTVQISKLFAKYKP